MALYGERDRALREGLDFTRALGRDAPVEETAALLERQARYSATWEEEAAAREQVWQLRKRQDPAPPDREMWMAQCRLGWALHNCDEPDPRTSGLLKEAFERLKEADAAQDCTFSPQTLFAAEALCQFAEKNDDQRRLEDTQSWMRELSCAPTGAEPLEEMRIWQEWLDLAQPQFYRQNCGLNMEGMFALQKQVMQGLQRRLGKHHPEALEAAAKTVVSYLRAHEKTGDVEAFLAETFNADQYPLGSQKKPALTLFEDP